MPESEQNEDIEIAKLLAKLEKDPLAKSNINLSKHAGPALSIETYLTEKPCRICGSLYRFKRNNLCALKDRHS
jgi:hypothetical protein